MARLFILAGLVLVGVGVLLALGVPLGRLPGDFTFRRGSLTVSFPLATSILASIVLTLLLNWLFRR
ncbi:MAG: DUF2905 domain-containing protein [Vicinamibacterales bacterium]